MIKAEKVQNSKIAKSKSDNRERGTLHTAVFPLSRVHLWELCSLLHGSLVCACEDTTDACLFWSPPDTIYLICYFSLPIQISYK